MRSILGIRASSLKDEKRWLVIPGGQSYLWKSVAKRWTGNFLLLRRSRTYSCRPSQLWKPSRSSCLMKITKAKLEAIQWREFLHPFTSVETMTLESEDPVRLIAPALQEFARERSTLPALQTLLLTASSQPSGSPKEAIEQFIATRQSYGQPITVHY